MSPIANAQQYFIDHFESHQKVVQDTQKTLQDQFIELVDLTVQAVKQGNKILLFGNGGSAADAQHLATEFTVRYSVNRPAIAALSLATDSSALSAIGNDLGFDLLFSRQIEAIGNPGDIALAISTSGKSPNITKALEVAKKKGLIPAALCGKGGGDLVGLASPLLIVPSQSTAHIQEMHITIGHCLCACVEKYFM